MARQAIPRFDLYAALGVDPSADDAAVEAAYWDLFGQYGGDAEASDDRRIVRARLAREWLTDPDRRSRYDASRARAAARSAAKAAGSGAAAVGAVGEVDDEELAEDTIPWPAADLERQAAADRLAAMERQAAEVEQSESHIEWSATPAAAVEPADRGPRGRSATRPGRRQLRFIGWGAVIVAGIAAAFLIFSTLGGTDVANRETPTPPAQTAPPATATAVPTTEPTVQPTSPPPTAPGIDIAALQQASWTTMQSLIAAAGDGDVDTAQTYLGDTAPGLRASGLRRATFPDVTAQQMTITQDVAGYVALADETTRLTSIDGQSWTFDYGDRPLAAYRPGGEGLHDLWWSEGGTKHHIYIRISLATVSKSNVTITAKWSFDPSLPNDATYFSRSTLRITSVTFDDVAMPATMTAVPMVGLTELTTSAVFTGASAVPDELGVIVEITNPRADGTNDRANETTFLLAVR